MGLMSILYGDTRGGEPITTRAGDDFHARLACSSLDLKQDPKLEIVGAAVFDLIRKQVPALEESQVRAGE